MTGRALPRLRPLVAVSALAVLGVVLAGAATSSSVPVLDAAVGAVAVNGAAAPLGLDAAADLGRSAPAAAGGAVGAVATAVVAPTRDRHPLAVRRHGGDGPHWRVGLLGVLLAAAALVAPRRLGIVDGRRGDGPRPGRGGPALARAPPAAHAA